MPILSNFPGGAGGSGGLALAAVSNIKTLAASGKVYVKWTDPEDLIVAESPLAEWGGTLLVRKAGSMPTSRRDGTIVIDSKVRNQYQNSYFAIVVFPMRRLTTINSSRIQRLVHIPKVLTMSSLKLRPFR